MALGNKKFTTVVWLGLLVILLLAPFIFSRLFWWAQGPHGRCLVNMAAIHKTVITHANENGLKAGDPLSIADLIAAGYISEAPECPEGGHYTALDRVPDNKSVYLQCDQEGHVLQRKPRPPATSH